MTRRVLCLGFVLLVATAAGDSVVDVSAGRDVVLPCGAPQGTVLVLEWTQSRRCLLFYRDGKSVERYQDGSFRGRAEAQDPRLDGGNLGAVLRRVAPEDSGMYRCEALVLTPAGERRSVSENVRLTVSDGLGGKVSRLQAPKALKFQQETERAGDVEAAAAAVRRYSPLSILFLTAASFCVF